MMVPKTTAETLKHKINPSLELAAPQAVDVLLYTPGTRTPTHSSRLSLAAEQSFQYSFQVSLSLSGQFYNPEFHLLHQLTLTEYEH